MRIIGGQFKGRRFRAPSNLPTRPTTDQAKEALFNVLVNRVDFEDMRVLDLCSGIGSVSLEFVSRGVKSLTSVDRNSRCVRFQNECKDLLHIENWSIIRADILKFLPNTGGSFELIFADPPYDFEYHKRIHESIIEFEFLSNDGVFILEHDATLKTDNWAGFEQCRRYGRVHFSFFDQNLMK